MKRTGIRDALICALVLVCAAPALADGEWIPPPEQGVDGPAIGIGDVPGTPPAGAFGLTPSELFDVMSLAREALITNPQTPFDVLGMPDQPSDTGNYGHKIGFWEGQRNAFWFFVRAWQTT